MATKDADLASDYASDRALMLIEETTTAELTVVLEDLQYQSYSLSIVEEGASGVLKPYRMSGFDQNVLVNDWVFWDATKVDSDASEYTGSAGPVVNIVVQRYSAT